MDLSPAAYDRNVWYPVVGEALPVTGFAGIKVVVNLNSGTKPSWSTHSQGFSVDLHIDTQASGWGVTPGETIIYSDNYAWCPVSPVSYKQLEKGSIPILYLRGGGRYRVFSTYNASWKIYKDGYTWEVDNYSQSAMPSNSRPTPEGHTLKGEKGDKGKDGVDGTDGKDAVSVLVENAPLVFDTNDDGIVSPDISKLAKVKIMRGNRNVSDECSDVYSRDDMCVNCKCGVTQENGYISVSISSNNITKNDVIVDGVSKGKVPATSGYAVAQAAYDGVTYFAQVPFSVNVAKFTGVVAFDNKGYKSQFKEVTNRLNDTATKDDLKKAESDFKQTAREISLSVSEKAMGRRNMLPGSALRKMGEGWGASLAGDWLDGTYTVGYYGDQGILTSDGIGGSNCFKAKCYYDGNTIQYPGMRWNGAAGVRNIKIQSGKKYTISAWVKCDRTDMDIALECLWQPGEKTGSNERKGAVPSNGFYHYLTEVNTWTLITTTIDTTNAPYSYIEVNLFITHIQSGVTATAWFCRPMMEEGDTYNGWTPSPQDYDYIGGNLLDNTASLSLGGNLTYLEGTIIKNGYEPDINASYAKAPANSHTELVQFGEGTNDPIALSPNTDYIFSFWAKGTSLTAYAYRNNNNAEMVTEDCNGNFRSSTEYDDGNTYFTLTNQWKRYWVHWRTKSRTDFIPQMILLRTSSEAWIAKPKLEVGCTMTDWTEKRTDMVDRQTLLATGIDITNGKITITANNTIFRDNNGTTIALFTGGKINASLIDADQIEVKHLWAKSNDGASKVGYFGNTEEDACKIGDYTVAPLFIGGATAKESPFYVTSKGAMHATSGKIGYFTISPNGELMYDDGYTDVAHRPFGLSKEALYFTHTTDRKSNDAIVWVGRTNFSESSTGTVGLLSDIWIDERVSTPTKSKACLFLSAEGYTGEDTDYKGGLMGNFAIYAKKGAYAGFRPAVRIAIENCQLTDMDCVIYVPVTGVYFTLPDNPQKGQYYKFIQGSEGKQAFWIKSNSYKMYWNGVDTNGRTSFDSGACNQTTEFIFLGDHWRVNWYREAAI